MFPAAASGVRVPLELRLRLGDLYAEYCEALDAGELERWPGFFLEACLYKVMPLENFERNLPIALVFCESRGMLQDRVTALRETALFAPRQMRHMVSGLRILAAAPDGIRLGANFAVLETLVDHPTRLFLAGRYHDRVVEDGGTLRFAERICVYDSTIVPTSLVFPI